MRIGVREFRMLAPVARANYSAGRDRSHPPGLVGGGNAHYSASRISKPTSQQNLNLSSRGQHCPVVALGNANSNYKTDFLGFNVRASHLPVQLEPLTIQQLNICSSLHSLARTSLVKMT
jgi:hypothetical protein